MSERKWIPAAWMDEVVPTCGASPDDFLKRNADGVLQLTPIDGDEGENWPPTVDLQPGQEVHFCWMEDRGTATLVVGEDGTWFLDQPFDGEANCITDADGDDIAQSVEDYVTQRREYSLSDTGLEPGRHELWGWYWSDSIPHRVKVLESGAASFERVDG